MRTWTIFIRCIFAVFLFFILLICLFLLVPSINDAKASHMAKQAGNISLPEEIKVAEILHGCGNTSGTGDHMEVWVGILVDTELSDIELKEFFNDAYVSNVDETTLQTRTMTMLNQKFSSLNEQTDFSRYYIVEFIYPTVLPFFDSRGW